MSWVTVIWAMMMSACLTLAVMYFVVWCRDRGSWAYLCFFVLAIGVIGLAAGEMAAMYAKSPTDYGTAVRWAHFAYLFVLVGSLGFVHFYFGTGQRWLLGVALGLRLAAVVANFTTGLNLHIRAIQALQQVNFLGEPVSMLGRWTPNPWVRIGQLAALTQFVYVVDASLRLWRTGSRESRSRAVIVGGPLAFFILFSSAQAGLVAGGVLQMPIVVSFPFLAVLLAMGYELSRDVLRAVQLGRDLHESEQRLSLATDSAQLGMWVWDIGRDEIWTTNRGRALFGCAGDERLDLDRFLSTLYPEDREAARQAVMKSLPAGGEYEREYRIALPDGQTRWITAHGRIEVNGAGQPVRMRGVSVDITARKEAELATRRHLTELAHATRVTALGELAGSLAHELNQPLTAILSNAQAAQRFLKAPAPDLEELRDILHDIVHDDTRAGEIIRRMRALVKKDVPDLQPVDLGLIIHDVAGLLHGDAVIRNIQVKLELNPHVSLVQADRIQLQQVMLNLLLNAFDAMKENGETDRRVTVRLTSLNEGTLQVAVGDRGVGLKQEQLDKLFRPFHTTKPQGLGLGLSISRSIVEAHGGRLWAENNPDRGATFHFTLPVAGAEKVISGQ